MMVERYITKKLLEQLNHFPVVGILGPRQVGKTTLAKQIIPRLPTPPVYLDLELPSDLAKLQEPELYLAQHEDKCVIIDEIQRMPGLFTLLRALIDRKRTAGRFLILGSASPNLLKDASESLAGRVSYIELSPFHLKELPGNTSYQEHWFRGGFPEAFLADSDRQAVQWLEAFIQTYIERDIPLLGLNVSPQLIYRFWTMLAHYHGAVWNASHFGRALGVSHTTVNRYLDFLEGALLVRRLIPFYTNIKKRLVKSPRIYLRDSGILHRLLKVADFEELQGHPLIGVSWEGYAIEQIRNLVNSDRDLYFYRTQSGAECDLLIAKAHTPVAAIEIKYTSTPKAQKGFWESINDLGTAKNYIITPASDDYLLSRNIRVCSLPVFIQQYLAEL